MKRYSVYDFEFKRRSTERILNRLYRELQIAYQIRRCNNVIAFNGKPIKDVKKVLIRRRGSADMTRLENTFSGTLVRPG